MVSHQERLESQSVRQDAHLALYLGKAVGSMVKDGVTARASNLIGSIGSLLPGDIRLPMVSAREDRAAALVKDYVKSEIAVGASLLDDAVDLEKSYQDAQNQPEWARLPDGVRAKLADRAARAPLVRNMGLQTASWAVYRGLTDTSEFPSVATNGDLYAFNRLVHRVYPELRDPTTNQNKAAMVYRERIGLDPAIVDVFEANDVKWFLPA